MKKITPSKFVSVGGLLTTITVILQAAPVFLSAIGMGLSPLSTLPIAIASTFNIYLGMAVLIASAFILTFVSLEETLILIFTTGLLGFVMGALFNRKKMMITILSSTIALTLGILTLIYVITIPSFNELTNTLPTTFIVMIVFLFSVFYTILWSYILQKFLQYLKKSKIHY